ncbi:MAG: AAA family ATPase [Clostridium sp.]|nr:AAA family ATPase [Clostridium sp.]
MGKTKAARQFLKDNPTNSVLITVNPCNSAIKPLLENIADKIGAGNERTIDKLWISIANKLSDGMVLIFDEAQHLSYKAIEALRSFSDYFADQDETLGICFIGNTDTVGRLGSKRAEFAQIANRTKQRKIYSKDTITRNDIIKLFPILKSENKDKEIDLLWRVAKTPQAIRGVINVFSNAYDNGNYSYEGIIAMMKFMDIAI